MWTIAHSFDSTNVNFDETNGAEYRAHKLDERSFEVCSLDTDHGEQLTEKRYKLTKAKVNYDCEPDMKRLLDHVRRGYADKFGPATKFLQSTGQIVKRMKGEPSDLILIRKLFEQINEHVFDGYFNRTGSSKNVVKIAYIPEHEQTAADLVGYCTFDYEPVSQIRHNLIYMHPSTKMYYVRSVLVHQCIHAFMYLTEYHDAFHDGEKETEDVLHDKVF